jgi:hypothetical protein
MGNICIVSWLTSISQPSYYNLTLNTSTNLTHLAGGWKMRECSILKFCWRAKMLLIAQTVTCPNLTAGMAQYSAIAAYEDPWKRSWESLWDIKGRISWYTPDAWLHACQLTAYTRWRAAGNPSRTLLVSLAIDQSISYTWMLAIPNKSMTSKWGWTLLTLRFN